MPRSLFAPRVAALTALSALTGAVALLAAAEEAATSSLAPCPDRPNCVSSLAVDEVHRVAPLEAEGDADATWRALREVVAGLPRTQIVDERPGYLHAECRSRLFRFVDDLELERTPDGLIQVRSASRVGYSDLGVNRDRVETLRAAWQARGVVAAPTAP